MQGLDTLLKLRDLNLSGNRICEIGQSLETLTEVEELRLSGNKIASFKVLTQSLGLCPTIHTIHLGLQ